MEANENHISPLFMDPLDIISSLQIQEHSIYIEMIPPTISSVISFLHSISKDPTHNFPRFQCYLSLIFKSVKLSSNLIFISSFFLFLSIISTPLNLMFPIIWILQVIRELSLYQPNLATCSVESNHWVPWRSIIKLMSNSQRYPHIFSLVFAEIFLFLLSPSLRETTWVDMLKKDLINLVKIYAMWH